MVRLSVAKIQPKTSLMVLQEPSPSNSFLTETGCRHVGGSVGDESLQRS
jgi:hypothetical protein